MEKIVFSAFIFLFVSFSVIAQTTSAALQEANKMSAEVQYLRQIRQMN